MSSRFVRERCWGAIIRASWHQGSNRHWTGSGNGANYRGIDAILTKDVTGAFSLEVCHGVSKSVLVTSPGKSPLLKFPEELRKHLLLAGV